MSAPKRSSRFRFADMRMEKKLLVVFVLLILFPLFLIGAISYGSYSHSIQNNTAAYSQKLIGQVIDRLDDYIDDMTALSAMPSYVDDFKKNLDLSNRYAQQHAGLGEQISASDDYVLRLSIQRGIEDNMNMVNTFKGNSSSIYVFDSYGSSYYSAAGGGLRLDIEGSYRYWREKTRDSGGKALLLPTQAFESNLQSTRYAFTVVRQVMDGFQKPIGLIAVDTNVSAFEPTFDELDQVTRGRSLVVDAAGVLVYGSGMRDLGTNISGSDLFLRFAGEQGSFVYDPPADAGSGRGKQLVVYDTSKQTGWKVVLSIPLDALTREAAHTRNATLAATLGVTLIALLSSIFLSSALTRPLDGMMQLMKRVQQGDLGVRFQVRRRDEIGRLGSQFNFMLVRIEELIADIYRIEAQKKEAELGALQSQINPHFVYNTLEAIRMTAELNDDVDSADMIALLGRMLRYSTGDPGGEATVREELEHAARYVDLLNYRYRGRFALEIEVPEELMDERLPRLTLQPIIENAAYHGLDDKPLMRLRIEAGREKDKLRFRLSDSGCGMDPATLERLNRDIAGGLPSRKRVRGGVGLKNVHHRLALRYGPGCGLRVFSEPGIGTTVDLSLPPGGPAPGTTIEETEPGI
ncbi:cache domain-containing sensor histidine kinase [Saccharibacillus alkalitolerans]|uniref:Sensor histidine kinase n=1 Tax=Saccharibacillus alkalitolerans TaxID=2705290 RepID=A0ABX0F7Z1_9BACL|nr:sensor histidine kinase [Saccharibacillus alkalitolerans]NGZ75326.1 sensor histidine kinase [Saccharibacillus alkalitolerans]